MQFSHAQTCHLISNLNLFGWRVHVLILTILFLLTSSQLLEIVMTSLHVHVACITILSRFVFDRHTTYKNENKTYVILDCF